MDFSSFAHNFLWILCWSFSSGYGYIVKLDKGVEGHSHGNTQGYPWPLPKRWDKTDILMTIDPEDFKFNSNVDCHILQDAFRRYRNIILESGVVFKSKLYRELESIDVDIQSGECEQFPWEYMDERYDLRVSMEGIVFLTARSIWGVLRGLETFSQLVWRNSMQQLLVNKTTIEDAPRYRHRGIMVDTSSHFIPKQILMMNLDAMSYNKMNVFHWNLIGDESFPYASSRYPELYKQGAYSRKHVYTQSDVREVIEYARLRGIRVIPHINVISHHDSIKFSHPDIFLPCLDESGNRLSTTSLHHPERVMIDPTKSATYSLLRGIIYELVQLFPDPMIHIGFDDKTNACWTNSAEIRAAVTEHDWPDIFSNYYTNITSGTATWGRSIQWIVWQNAVEKNTPVNGNTTLVQIIKSSRQLVRKLKRANLSVILSWDNFVDSRQSWTDVITENFKSFKGLPERHIAGGEALVWTGNLDGTNLIPRLWPKASTLAEILWSHQIRDFREVMFRLDEQRCRLVRRDLPATPLFAGHCGDREYDGLTVNRSSNERKLSASVLYVLFICLLDAMRSLFQSATLNAEPS